MDRPSKALQTNDPTAHQTSISNNGQVSVLATRNKERALQNKEDASVFDTRNVIKTLDGLMTRVTEEECNPETVNAACNAADKITQLLRVHLDVEKFKRKYARTE